MIALAIHAQIEKKFFRGHCTVGHWPGRELGELAPGSLFALDTVVRAVKWAYNPNHSPNLDASPNH